MDCPFCSRDQKLILEESKHSIVTLSKFPGEYGHILVMPKIHIKEFYELSIEQSDDLMIALKRAARFIAKDISGGDYILHYNGGRVYGRTIVNHAHFHLIPMKSEACGNIINVKRRNEDREVISDKDIRDLHLGWFVVYGIPEEQ